VRQEGSGWRNARLKPLPALRASKNGQKSRCPSVNLTIWISLLLALGCAAATIVISITQNGLVIGLPISIFKILTTVLVLAVIAVYFFEKFRTKRRSIFETVVFGGLIGWIVSRLVNGERFRQRQSNTI